MSLMPQNESRASRANCTARWTPPWSYRLATAGLFVGMVAAIALVAGCGPGKPPVSRRRPPAESVGPSKSVASVELVPVRTSRFANTQPGVAFIGNDACAKCHHDQHHSYLATSHSRAMEVLTNDEPPAASFFHEPSRRQYTIVKQDGEMLHREVLKAAKAEADFTIEHAVKYAIGSGNHSRSYLCEADGFLVESPLTWYAAKQAWKMSPGYDSPAHPSFSRVVGVTCLICHAGRVEGVEEEGGENLYRASLQQMSIGCESCHGPGGEHQKYHQSQTHPAGEPDLTIVNLSRLTGPEQDAICAHCHLRGDATVLLRGRRLADYRPGLRNEDFRIDYSLVSEDGPMTVVGHMEQMRSSQCYIQSQSMSCTSCHDPHESAPAEKRSMFYRQKCAACHVLDDAPDDAVEADERSTCKLTLADRQKISAENNCVHCHMPQGDTEIPHFAFTHHRIGIHAADEKETGQTPSKPPRLKPIQDVSHLPKLERDRALGLAYLEVSGKAANDYYATFHQREAKQLLDGVREAGMQDSRVESALAQLAWAAEDRLTAMAHAEEALRLDPLDPNAMYILADVLHKRHQSQRALQVCLKLTRIRRVTDDWQLLSKIYVEMDKLQDAVAALRQATKITPFREDVWADLAETAGRAHDHQTEDEALETLQLLRRN